MSKRVVWFVWTLHRTKLNCCMWTVSVTCCTSNYIHCVYCITGKRLNAPELHAQCKMIDQYCTHSRSRIALDWNRCSSANRLHTDCVCICMKIAAHRAAAQHWHSIQLDSFNIGWNYHELRVTVLHVGLNFRRNWGSWSRLTAVCGQSMPSDQCASHADGTFRH